MYKFTKINDVIKVHKELNPKLWNSKNELKSEVKKSIQQIVNKFIEYLNGYDIKIKVKDIYFLGSNANYNYTSSSDIDIHIIADFKPNECNKKHLDKLYYAYKTLFNDKYDFTINGYDCEIYVEDANNLTNSSNGVYSLNKGWIKEPTLNDVSYNKIELKKKFDVAKEKYFTLLKSGTVNSIQSFIDKIHDGRLKDLSKDNEFGLDNLLYKEMRNKGYISKLNKRIVELEEEKINS